MSLDEIRERIDAIDGEMRALFEKRMDCVQDVVNYKSAHHMTILDQGREDAMLDKNLRHLKNQNYADAYQHFLLAVVSASRIYQQHQVAEEEKGRINKENIKK